MAQAKALQSSGTVGLFYII